MQLVTHQGISVEPISKAIKGDRPKLTLHVGPGKTGTTAIQKSLAKFAPYLAENDFAAFTIQFDMPAVFAYFSPWRFGRSSDPTDLPLARKEFEKAVTGSGKGNVIVSSEFMAGSMLRNGAPSVKKTRLLTSAFTDISIVFYIRRQDNMYESIFQQQHKSGEAKSFYEFRENNPVELLDYYERIEMFRTAFPEASIRVVPYEFMISENDILRNFLETVGLQDLPARIQSYASNLSLSRTALHILEVARESMTPEETESLRNLFTTSYPLTSEVASKNYNYLDSEERLDIVRRFRDSNRRIFLEFGVGDQNDFERWERFHEEVAPQESGSVEGDLNRAAIGFLARSLVSASSPKGLRRLLG